MVFDDVRVLVAGVLDGLDDLIGTIFAPPRDEHADNRDWELIVSNRDGACSLCAKPFSTGEQVYAARTARDIEFRCLSCGGTRGQAADADSTDSPASS
jgi:hypothetical protein